MAKIGGGALKQALQEVRATKKALARDRMRDYRVARDVNEAIFKNLAGYQARVGRRLTKQNRRLLEAMERVATRGERLSAKTRDEVIRALFSGRLMGRGGAYGPARVTLKAGEQVTEAQQKMGRGLARTGNLALQLAEAGAAEAQASAEAALAQALQARTAEDVRLVAQMQHDVLMAKLQHQLALEQMEKEAELAKKQMLFEQKLAAGQLGKEGGVVASMTEELARVSIAMREYVAANPDTTPAEVLQHLVTTGVLTPEEAQQPPYARLADIIVRSQLTRGPGTLQPTVEAILMVIRHFWPNYAKYDRLRALAEKTIRYYGSLGAAPAQPSLPTPTPSPAPKPVAFKAPVSLLFEGQSEG